MIAADTGTWVAFLEGESGALADLLDRALADRRLSMIPAVLTELLSDPQIPDTVAEALTSVSLLDTAAGYWQRAGVLRAGVLATGRKARLGDALIAQSCLDQRIPLITRDRDRRVFASASGAELQIEPAT